MLNAGTLDQRITIERPDNARDAAGAIEPGWAEVVEVSARVAPIRGRERLTAGDAVADMDTRIVFHWRPELDEINPSWRILHRGRIYDIVSAIDVESRHRVVEVMARTGANEG